MKMSFNDTLKKEAFALDISFGEEDSLNYEDKIVDNKWVEKELAIFPIEIKVDETPIDHTNGRSQIYCKFIDLNINTNNSKLELSI